MRKYVMVAFLFFFNLLINQFGFSGVYADSYTHKFKKVIPILEQVQRNDDGTCVAYFGWNNPNDETISAISSYFEGDEGRLESEPISEFASGRHICKLQIVFDCDWVRWVVFTDGYEKISEKAYNINTQSTSEITISPTPSPTPSLEASSTINPTPTISLVPSTLPTSNLNMKSYIFREGLNFTIGSCTEKNIPLEDRPENIPLSRVTAMDANPFVETPKECGTFMFYSSRFFGCEGYEMGVTIVRLDGDSGVSKVYWEIEGGLADIGIDYISDVSGELLFESGELSKTIRVPILSDILTENIETIELKIIGTSDGAYVGKTSHTTVFINDVVEGSSEENVDSIKCIYPWKKDIEIHPDNKTEGIFLVKFRNGSKFNIIPSMIVYKISNNYLVSIVNGEFLSKGYGKTTIKAFYGDISTNLYFNSGPLSLNLKTASGDTFGELAKESNINELNLPLNTSVKVAVFLREIDGSIVDVTDKVIFFSSLKKIASIGIDGIVTENIPGISFVSVKYGNKKITFKINTKLQYLKCENMSSTLNMKPNDINELVIMAKFSNGTVEDVSNKCIWSTSNPKIATVNNGKIMSVGIGKCTVRAKYGNLNVSKKVNTKFQKLVLNVDERINISSSDKYINITATFADGSTKDVTLEAKVISTNNKVIEFESNKILPLQLGTSKIISTYSGIKSNAIDVTIIE